MVNRKSQARGARRRDEILQAALACFTAHGLENTTIEMIRDRSGASIGSLYHHFGGKEQIATTLYLQGLREYAEALMAALDKTEDARSGIAAMVHSYIDWVTQNPDWARFIFSARGRVIQGEAAASLREDNRRQFMALKVWLQPHIERGILRELPQEIYHALVNGPVQDYCRHWLAGRIRHSPLEWKETFAEAAWRSVAESSERSRS